MAKAKSKPLTLKQRLERLEQRFPNGGGLDVDQLSVFNTKQQNRIAALEEAICPRVAARLTALERSEKQQSEINDGIGDRLNADDGDKKRVFEVLQQMRNTVLGRVSALEQNAITFSESIAILVNKQTNAADAADAAPVVIEDTAENRRWLDLNLARGKGQCSAPSKADDPYMIWKIARKVFLAMEGKPMDEAPLNIQNEVYDRMKTIIKIVEQA